MPTRLFRPVLALSLCLGLLLPARADDREQAAKASLAIEALKGAIETLIFLPESCLQTPRQCSAQTLDHALDLSLFRPEIPLIDDTLATRQEVTAALLHLLLKAKPEQLQKLRAASLAYRQSLDEFQREVLGDQQSAMHDYRIVMERKNRISAVKANMHTLQTTAETYAVDWAGKYPPDLKTLQAEASRPGLAYWHDVTNPFTQQAGLGAAVADYQRYQSATEHRIFAGMVLYQPIKAPDGSFSSYKIYGCDDKGELVMQQDRVFVLSNE